MCRMKGLYCIYRSVKGESLAWLRQACDKWPSTPLSPDRHFHAQADEELLLLEGVDMAGLGNWTAVAEHVGTKSQQACKQHYYDIYINSPAFPEPMPAPSMASIDKLQVCHLIQPKHDWKLCLAPACQGTRHG